MHFDDRLATVLRQPPRGEGMVRVQYRQLVDLLGTAGAEGRGEHIDAAYIRLAELSGLVPSGSRASILREPGLRLRNPRLLAQLAADQPQVASAAISSARLDEEQWLDLIPALPLAARGALRDSGHLPPRALELLDRLGIRSRSLPPATIPAVEESPPEPSQAPLPSQVQPDSAAPARQTGDESGIRAIVERIEKLSRARREKEISLNDDSPPLPLDGLEEDSGYRRLKAFDFTTGSDGRIAWAESAAAPMIVGTSLASTFEGAPLEGDEALVAAFQRRQPILGSRVKISGAPVLSGEWRIDAHPRFSDTGGGFQGYAGRMRRPIETSPEEAPDPRVREADRIRQVLHELRTPVNAIHGFAEAIQQALFGPITHNYRALAAGIAADAARIMAGFDEIERMVKLDAGALDLEPGQCDFGAIVAETISQLEAYSASRNSGFKLHVAGEQPVGLCPREARQLAWRILASLAGAMVPGETLDVRIEGEGGFAAFAADLPSSLAHLPESDLFAANPAIQNSALVASIFGTGFALRLAASELDAAGGSLSVESNTLRLTLPRLTASEALHSEEPVASAASGGG